MGSNLHYTLDLNEDQNCQPFFSSLGSSLHQQHFHQQASSNPSYSMSPSLSYFPLLINSHHQDQVSVGLNNNIFHGVLDTHLSQPLQIKKFVLDSGSSSSDQTVPKKTRLKLKIKKKDNHQDRSNLPQYPTKGKIGTNTLTWVSTKVKLMKKKNATITTTNSNNKQHFHNDQSSNQNNLEGDHLKKNSRNQYNIIVNQNGYNGSNDCVVRFCSDCNTTKTPLWRSGPKGPKSLCNACGIRQRKARRAAAMATATTISDMSPPLLKKKIQNKKKKSNGVSNISSPSDERMITVEEAQTAQVQSESTMLSSSFSSDKFYLDDLAIILSKSSAYQQVFPQDEKEAAILLMALSYGMVRG